MGDNRDWWGLWCSRQPQGFLLKDQLLLSSGQLLPWQPVSLVLSAIFKKNYKCKFLCVASWFLNVDNYFLNL